ncbi:ribokinase [Microbacterium sp. EYE_5]|nr:MULTISPECIES: PfkB family carbohydrate kinase [unclassified Microbacterium]MCK6079286.1 ribokinase [Microbacterium sp. EYE_382]MCK6123215.1 ribokinase [Microbacterium sp. EYE_80]MCK6125320.1 ribokinase [Microbacterium sp. EYE_79]MCK6140240.1 ribokinase [Microbacterium sp. EYE_39]MCK6246630.1 ribokinase [Microbacterium sp. EYE_78]
MTTAERPRLTVVGAINVDLVASVARAPERGETVADGALVRQPGGKGANQAAAAARLGARVDLIGAVGTDPAGRDLLDGLTAAGVGTAGVQLSDGDSGTALIVVDADGENSIVVCPEANARIDADAVAAPTEGAVLAQLEVADAVIERAIAATSGLVVVNAAPSRPFSDAILERADVFIVNEHEYAALPQLRDAELVAVTLGAAGAELVRRGEVVARVAARRATVVNTVGAGDAFCAALTIGLVRGDDPAEALARACEVGAAAVEDPLSQPALGPLDTYAADA